jgi:hypothetical protein
MFCPDCGSEVAEGRKFCGKCGGLIHATAGSIETTLGAVPQEAAPTPRQPLSTRQKLTYALVALLVVLCGVGWWWFNRPAPAYKAQDPGIYPFSGLSADGKTEKTGFIDADGKVLVQPEWDSANFSSVMGQLVYCNEGLCGVLKDGKWGFIDASGKLVISTQFDAVDPFIEGLARVKLGNQFGYIDKTGQYAINPQFSQAGDFHGGLAVAYGDGGWGFINKTGAYVIKPHFQAVDLGGFSGGLAAVCLNGKCGYIDRTGTYVIAPTFTGGVNGFSEGMASVRVNNKWGFINTTGKIVINPQFDGVTLFSGGLAVVSVSGNTGTINKQGKYILNPGQYNIQMREGDLQPVVSSDGQGLMTRDGKWVIIPCKVLVINGGDLGKVFYGSVNGQYVPISISGKVLAGQYKGAMLNTLAQDIENKAQQSMNQLTVAEASYSSAYPAKGFTANLAALGPAQGSPNENSAGYIDAALATGTKDGYQFTVTIPAGTSIGGANLNYLLLGRPAAGHMGNSYCADSSGSVHSAAQGVECTVTSPTQNNASEQPVSEPN